MILKIHIPMASVVYLIWSSCLLTIYLSQHSRAGINAVAVHQCESEWHNFQAFRQDEELNTDLASWRSTTGLKVQNIVCNLHSLLSETYVPWHGSHCLLGNSMVISWKMLIGLLNIFQMRVLSVPHMCEEIVVFGKGSCLQNIKSDARRSCFHKLTYILTASQLYWIQGN